MKFELTVSSMVCEVCADTVKKAVISQEPTAQVIVDLSSKKVTVETSASQNKIEQAIIAAGHTVN